MSVVLLNGRKLPNQDWEGDDFTPGAKGFVTCTDTSVGRAVAYATNGRVDIDGKVYRAAIVPRDPDGVNLPQIAKIVPDVAGAGVELVVCRGWDLTDALNHLKAAKGLVMQGWYAEIPRSYRYQANASFGHAMFASHYSRTSGVRVWDALDANLTHHGQWIPWPHVRDFMERWRVMAGAHGLLVGYVPLQHL